jgi:biotin carboxylase
VFCCTSEEEVKKGFDKINGAINGLGVVNEGVLIQEFLEGTEYVVDTVSRDGVSKVTAIWEYDKRHVNDQFNVYFGMKVSAASCERSEVERSQLFSRQARYLRGRLAGRETSSNPSNSSFPSLARFAQLLPADDELTRSLVAYQDSVLKALEIVNGPAHAEVMMTKTGPCLVEVGSRCHGGEGTWQPIVEGCNGVGTDQINATVDAYLRPDEWDKVPLMCGESMQRYGREVFLVAREDGRIKSMPGVDVIMALPSFVKAEMAVQVGDDLRKTVDCFTRPGAVQLIHEDAAVVEADYVRIRELELEGMFELY